jgi:biotin carboxylase
MNVELVIDKNNRCFLIDVGPRSGGNMIPDLLGMIFDVDIPELCVKCAMGEEIEVNAKDGHLYYATHNLHSNKNGILVDIKFSKDIEKFIIKKCIYVKRGDNIQYFDNAAKVLGIIFLKFNNGEEMNKILSHINDYINVQTTND